jgi:hypothetical protein
LWMIANPLPWQNWKRKPLLVASFFIGKISVKRNFFLSILWYSQSDDHPQEGFSQNMATKVKNFKHPSMFLAAHLNHA